MELQLLAPLKLSKQSSALIGHLKSQRLLDVCCPRSFVVSGPIENRL